MLSDIMLNVAMLNVGAPEMTITDCHWLLGEGEGVCFDTLKNVLKLLIWLKLQQNA
jgi:hypothetical protein